MADNNLISEKPINPCSDIDRSAIYEAIGAGVDDEEIKERFGLKKMQLAGYKAARKRVPGSRGKPDHLSGKIPDSNHGHNGFEPGELELITGKIKEGIKATEIADMLLDDEGNRKYTWQRIAFYGIRNDLYKTEDELHEEIKPRQRSVKRLQLGKRISPKDGVLIVDFYVEGESPEDIARLFDDRYHEDAIKKYLGNLDRIKEGIRKRDNYTCRYPGCGTTAEGNNGKSGHNLHVHHIKEVELNPQLEYDPKNMITLCTSCHVKTNLVKFANMMNPVLEQIVERHYSAKTGNAKGERKDAR